MYSVKHSFRDRKRLNSTKNIQAYQAANKNLLQEEIQDDTDLQYTDEQVRPNWPIWIIVEK